MDASSSEPPVGLLIGILVGFPIVFVTFWSFVCLVLGLVSGWMGLGSRYRTQAPEPGFSVTAGHAGLGLVGYGFTLQLGAAADGLDLRLMPLFRPGHPPLRIPWDQVQAEGAAFSLIGRAVKLRLGEGGPVLRVSAETWEQVQRQRPR